MSFIKNNGDGTFSNVASSAGVNDDSTGIDIAWGDYNNDGFLDLYLVNDVGAGYGAKNLLYKNNGDDTFTNVADEAGVSSRGMVSVPPGQIMIAMVFWIFM